MSKDVSFALDAAGGRDILTNMVAPVVSQAAKAIGARAQSIAGSMSSEPPTITVTEATPGTIKKGVRAIATVRASGVDSHANYIGHMALAKSKDAGRV